MVLCTSYLFRRNVDGVTHYCCVLYVVILNSVKGVQHKSTWDIVSQNELDGVCQQTQ